MCNGPKKPFLGDHRDEYLGSSAGQAKVHVGAMSDSRLATIMNKTKRFCFDSGSRSEDGNRDQKLCRSVYRPPAYKE